MSKLANIYQWVSDSAIRDIRRIELLPKQRINAIKYGRIRKCI